MSMWIITYSPSECLAIVAHLLVSSMVILSSTKAYCLPLDVDYFPYKWWFSVEWTSPVWNCTLGPNWRDERRGKESPVFVSQSRTPLDHRARIAHHILCHCFPVLAHTVKETIPPCVWGYPTELSPCIFHVVTFHCTFYLVLTLQTFFSEETRV